MWDDGTIWEGARAGELRLRTCTSCCAICHPPLPVCPRCQNMDWAHVAASGEAKVRDWFVSTHPTQPDLPPRLTVVVELDEGVRFVSNLLDCTSADIHEGMAVRLCFVETDGLAVPQFRPVTAA